MSEVWGSSSLSPTNTTVFNWKIENFDRMLKTYGKLGFESPSFNVVSKTGEVQHLQLRLAQMSLLVGHGKMCKLDELAPNKTGNVFSNMTENAVDRPMTDFALIELKVVNGSNDLLIAGKIELGLDGKTIVGALGDVDNDDFQGERVFVRKDPIQVIYSGNWYSCAGFCVAKSAPILEIKVQLSTPVVVTNTVSFVPSDQTVKEVGAARLMSDMRILLTNASEYADFTIVCDGEKFPCNEAILRVRSPVLDKMFQQKMKETTTRELKLDDVKKGTVRAFLEYLYTGEVLKTVESYSELIYIADKYHVSGLLEFCFHKLPEIEDGMILDVLILADRHNLEKFKKVAMQRVLKKKSKFLKDDDFVNKMNQAPNILMDFFQI